MNFIHKLLGIDKLIEKNAWMGGRTAVRSGTFTGIGDNPTNYLHYGYNYNDIVYSIISLITDYVKSVEWKAYKEDRKGNLKPYDDDRLNQLLDRPNDYESFSELVGNHAAFKLLTGNSYIYTQRVTDGANEGLPEELWLLPADLVNLLITKTFPPRITGYQIQGWNIEFRPEDIIHSKEFNPNMDVNGSQLYGQSPLKSALGLINRTNSAMKVSTNKFQNGGLESIIYVDDDRFTAEQTLAQATAIKSKLKEYDEEGRRVAVSGYKTGVTNLGLSPVELNIIASEQWDLRRLCNIYGVPPQLMGDTEGSTFNNQKEAGKSLVNRVVIPILKSVKQDFNRKLKEWGYTEGVIIDYDQTVFTELEEDRNEQMRWLMPLMEKGLPLNRVLEILNLEKIEDEYYDLPRVTQSMGETLEDHKSNEVDDVLNEAMSALNNRVNGQRVNGN
jgi:HK97 family phage portal protein